MGYPGWLGRASLVRSERSPRGDGIGPRGRRRRPRVQQHARNDASVVHTDFQGDWRLLNEIAGLASKIDIYFNVLSTLDCIRELH